MSKSLKELFADARAEMGNETYQRFLDDLAGKPLVSAHKYVPHPKYPWFCDVCGYPKEERLQHRNSQP